MRRRTCSARSLTVVALKSSSTTRRPVAEDYPPLAKDPLGGTLTLFLECEGIEHVLKVVEKAGAKIVMPLKTQFYGMREFAFQDPRGWIVTMAERTNRNRR